MFRIPILLALVVAGTAGLDAQRTGPASLAISVTDESGRPLTGVRISLDGSFVRRTERGRVALEELPTGTHRLTFELAGYATVEREVVARRGAPVDVKVTMVSADKAAAMAKAAPPAKAAVAPPAKTAAAPSAKTAAAAPARTAAATPAGAAAALGANAAVVDVPSFLESNFIGRGDSKVSSLACTPAGDAVVVQIRQPLEEHGHADADEFVYVIAGEGTARLAEDERPLKAGVFLMIPRAMRHAFTARGRNPLIFLSIKSAGAPLSCRT